MERFNSIRKDRTSVQTNHTLQMIFVINNIRTVQASIRELLRHVIVKRDYRIFNHQRVLIHVKANCHYTLSIIGKIEERWA